MLAGPQVLEETQRRMRSPPAPAGRSPSGCSPRWRLARRRRRQARQAGRGAAIHGDEDYPLLWTFASTITPSRSASCAGFTQEPRALPAVRRAASPADADPVGLLVRDRDRRSRRGASPRHAGTPARTRAGVTARHRFMNLPKTSPRFSARRLLPARSSPFSRGRAGADPAHRPRRGPRRTRPHAGAHVRRAHRVRGALRQAVRHRREAEHRAAAGDRVRVVAPTARR